MGWLSTFVLTARIAFRNLFASRLKTVIVGGIIFFGAFLVVLLGSLVDSIDSAMRRSVVGSVAGHIQVYSAESKDEVEVMGGFSMEGADLEPLDFGKVQQALMTVPNVKSVVPMGISGAIVASGNTIDIALEKLRETVRQKSRGGSAVAEYQGKYEAQKSYVRHMLQVLRTDRENMGKIRQETAQDREEAAAIARGASDEFWANFDRDPLDALEFLENKVAPAATDADMLFLRYVGTDPAQFAKTFDRLKIVDGQAIPPGKRGFLFSKYVYEEQLKLKTAHRLDKIKVAIEERGKKIATDPELERYVRENSTQVRELLLQLDEPKTLIFRSKLQKELGSTEADVGKLLASFFKTDDTNFMRRYKFFYDELAPSLDLYRVRVGDTLVIKAFTKGGYVQSVKLRVYGTFAFQGLETSALAGGLSLMDMVSFRELYGFLTTEKKAEIDALKASSGAKEVARDKAEEELFGTKDTSPSKTVEATVTPGIPKVDGEGLGARLRREDLVDKVFDPKELGSGVVLNAAVILNDPNKLDQTMKSIEAKGKEVGLPLKTASWQKASGFIGQMVGAMHGILSLIILIIFTVALVIINNALVMATLQRVPEIGTLRAVGAQRRFVLTMLVIEALVVGAVFGALGAGMGALATLALHAIGIPSGNDIMSFFFSGPRLHPTLGTGNVIFALVIVFLISALSSLYPAWLAMRVTPRQAMATED
jgi:ABC-type lipoprotein release transport system permease subunit